MRRFLAAMAFLLAPGCGPTASTRWVVSIDKEPDAVLPEYLLINVLRHGILSVSDLRIPDTGALTKATNPIATVQITLDGDITASRDVLISGISGGAVIAKAELLGITTTAASSRSLQLTLAAAGTSGPVLPAADGGAAEPPDAAQPMSKQDAAPPPADAALTKLDTPKAAPDTAPAAPVNLISNGGFEAGGTHWKTVNGNTAAVAAGPASAFALRSDGAAAWCQQDVQGFVPAKSYIVKATGKGDVAGCSVGVVVGNDVNGELQRNLVAPFGTTWKTEANGFVVPPAATWMFVFIHNNGSPTCWTDDVSVMLNET